MKRWLLILCKTKMHPIEEQVKQYRQIAEKCKGKGIITEAILCQHNIDKTGMPDQLIEHILCLQKRFKYEGIIFTKSWYSGMVAGKISTYLKSTCLTDVRRIDFCGQTPVFYKMAYNCNMEAGFLCKEKFVISLDAWPNEGESSEKNKENEEVLEELRIDNEIGISYLKDRKQILKKEKEENSEILIAVGKGISSKEEIEDFRRYSKEQGFLFGVSRPVAMNGWAKIDEIIGVSGYVYQPRICIAVGVSGSAAFYAGIERSKWIISINSDRRAPIVKMSDISIIEDYKRVWTSLKDLL